MWWSTTPIRINATTSALRWAEYAISASLMTFVLGVLHSVTDINALIGLVATNVATQYLGWLSNTNESPHRRLTFFIGILVFSMTWIPMLASFYRVADAGSVPEWVKWLVPVLTAAYATFPLIMGLRLFGVLDATNTGVCCFGNQLNCFGTKSVRNYREEKDETLPKGWWIRSSDHWFDIASFCSKALLDWWIVFGLKGWGSS